MSTDDEHEPVAPAVPTAASPPGMTQMAMPAESPGAQPVRKRTVTTKAIGIAAGSVVAAAAVFGGGVALGTSLTGSGSSSAQQGQFGSGGPGGMSGTAPNGTAPTGAPPGQSGSGTTTTG